MSIDYQMMFYCQGNRLRKYGGKFFIFTLDLMPYQRYIL